jgi:hypothetical protein
MHHGHRKCRLHRQPRLQGARPSWLYTPVSYDTLVHSHRWAVRWGPLQEGDIGDRVRLDAAITRYRLDVFNKE